jgi:hypothetical protein
MKTEVVKQVVVKFDKDEKESIKKVIALISDLINVGNDNSYDGYEIDDIFRDAGEFEDVIDSLKALAYAEVIELT